MSVETKLFLNEIDAMVGGETGGRFAVVVWHEGDNHPAFIGTNCSPYEYTAEMLLRAAQKVTKSEMIEETLGNA